MEKTTKGAVIHPAIRRDQLVTISDLQDFKEDLLLSIVRIIRDSAVKPPKKWLKSREVRALLGISSGTLYSLRIAGTLPFTKIGNLIYYDQDDVNSLLAANRKAVPPGGVVPQRRAA